MKNNSKVQVILTVQVCCVDEVMTKKTKTTHYIVRFDERYFSVPYHAIQQEYFEPEVGPR